MGQSKQEYLDWLCQQSKCRFCGEIAEDCGCSRGKTFTKGEWKITDKEINANGVEFIRIGCIDESVLGVRADKHIAFADNYENAQLISSAPDMYEALIELLNQYLFESQIADSPTIRKAKNAISKAGRKI